MNDHTAPEPAPAVPVLADLPDRHAPDPVTFDDLARLPVVLDLPTAARLLGIGRTAAYEMVRDGRWPTPVIRLSSRKIRVPSAPLLDLLGVDWRQAS